MTMVLRYTGLSAKIAFRNKRFLIFTVGLPLVMYLIYSNLYGGQTIDESTGYSVSTYLMISMAAFGGIGAAINSAARVAIERQTGWNRQLRLTALSPRAYLVSKAAVSMLLCLPAIALVFIAGRLVGGVHLSGGQWLGAGLALWLGLIPFTVVGLVIGFAATADSVQPMTMLVYLGSSLLGGLWFPLESMSSWMRDIAKVTPAYHLAAISRAVSGFGDFGVLNILVLLAWTAGLGAVGGWAYRRSGRRV
jgi:ABC-2 type transport system permease protein